MGFKTGFPDSWRGGALIHHFEVALEVGLSYVYQGDLARFGGCHFLKLLIVVLIILLHVALGLL